ncbi:MAG: HAMP domain-containing sensor histidine kinase [Rhodanobacter sp.]
MKPASLTARITALLVITSLLILGGGAKLMDWRVDHELESRFQENLLIQANALSDTLQLEQGELPGAILRRAPAGLLGGDGPTYYELRCAGAATLSSTPAPPVTPAGWPQATTTQPLFSNLHHGSQRLGAVQLAFTAATDDATRGTQAESGNTLSRAQTPPTCQLLFEQDRHTTDQILLAIDWILLLSPALALLITLVAVPIIVRRGLRPVDALVKRMHDIGPNAPQQRLAVSGLRELDPLVARFNDVLGRMDEGLARERQFASGLAHETRTRLAELRALTEVEARYPSGRSTPEILGEVRQIGSELEATVTALLLLTRLQSGLELPQLQPILLGPWLQHQLQRHQDSATQRTLELRYSGTPPKYLRTDPALLEVIVGNLLGNACAYATPGSTVVLALTSTSLSVSNAAEQLSADDLANFGQRFWRKQLPHAGHAGLGLALTSAATDALKLSLNFHLDSTQHLHASVTWPATDTQEPTA